MKIKELLEKETAFSKILGNDLPFKLAYRMRKIATKLEKEVKRINQARIDLMKKLGGVEEKGFIKFDRGSDDKLSAKGEAQNESFRKEWDLFLDEDIQVTFEKIPFECLDNDDVKMSAMDIAKIDDMIENPVPAKAQKK